MQKNIIVLLLTMTLALSPFLLYAETISKVPVQKDGEKMTTIKEKIQKNMDAINKKPGKGAAVQEIEVNRFKKKAGKEEEQKVSTGPVVDMGNLTLLNITGGLFEGGLIGAGSGLIWYSRGMNRDPEPIIAGAIAGMCTGAGLGAFLSMYQTVTKRYVASDDFGYDLMGGVICGIAIGGAGGLISYAKTEDTENISEGMGYGVLAGAVLGLTLGIVETVLPEEYRGASKNIRAFFIAPTQDGLLASCNLEF
ncbi:MAG: hypothetical protein LLG37_04575 [Spirochaetia bacterium]|nr:hypothetical protein [Spirochaetia bacterium]